MRTWSIYKANRVAQIIGFSAVALFLVIGRLPATGPALGDWINQNVLVSCALFLVALIVLIVPTFNLINWKCPGCRRLFSYAARGGRTCQHCGLPKLSDPQTAEG